MQARRPHPNTAHYPQRTQYIDGGRDGTVGPAILTAATPPPDGQLPIDTSSHGAQTETLPLYLAVANFL
jgi:hypothetical protein